MNFFGQFFSCCPARLRGHLAYIRITSPSTGPRPVLEKLLLLLTAAAVQAAPHNQRKEHVLRSFQLYIHAQVVKILFLLSWENLYEYEYWSNLVQHHIFFRTQHHHIVIVPIDCLTESQITRGWQFFSWLFFHFSVVCASHHHPALVKYEPVCGMGRHRYGYDTSVIDQVSYT